MMVAGLQTPALLFSALEQPLKVVVIDKTDILTT